MWALWACSVEVALGSCLKEIPGENAFIKSSHAVGQDVFPDLMNQCGPSWLLEWNMECGREKEYLADVWWKWVSLACWCVAWVVVKGGNTWQMPWGGGWGLKELPGEY